MGGGGGGGGGGGYTTHTTHANFQFFLRSVAGFSVRTSRYHLRRVEVSSSAHAESEARSATLPRPAAEEGAALVVLRPKSG